METLQEAERLTTHLLQWMERYLRNKDLVHKRIKTLEVQGDTLTVAYADHTHQFRILTTLPAAQEATAPLTDAAHCSIVTYHTMENFNALIRDWEHYAKFKRHFSLYFVNPFSRQDKLWVLYPASHHAISEDSNRKAGLNSIASVVDTTSLDELSTILASEAA